jgi:hypothetical protein
MLVERKYACPGCAERDQDRLVWIDDENVRCYGCQTEYAPGGTTHTHLLTDEERA